MLARNMATFASFGSRNKCRICLSDVAPKHSSALFTATALREDLPGRLSRLLLVAIAEGDGLPSHVCRHCRTVAESLESKLQKIRELAQESCRKFRMERSKRPNDSTGVGASPHTQKVQPPSNKLRSPVELFPYENEGKPVTFD